MLVIEIIAGRILAPYVGVSLYTWTSIIGVVLSGIGIGAYLGGRAADRFPQKRTLGIAVLLSGVAALSISPLTNLVTLHTFTMPLMWRILCVTMLIFLVPSCLLGMIVPIIARLVVKNLRSVGTSVGKVYAVSTVGSILGAFAAGFYLISWMGTRNVVIVLGAILILTAILFGSLFTTRRSAAVLLVFPPVLIWGIYDSAFKPYLRDDVYFYKESDYYTIKLTEVLSKDGKTRLEGLVLDNLLHSFVNVKNPVHLEYEYERIYAEVLSWRFRRDESFSTLTVGGGGYTLPRYMEALYPNARVDVVEIDPEVTNIAYKQLGLSRDTRIHTYNADGRWFVVNCRSTYDVIFIDTFHDLSVPYHLTTEQFAQQLKRILNPGGIIMTNIVDNFKTGLFLPSYIRTLREVFGAPNVHLLSVNPNFRDLGISTFIVLASNGSVGITDFEALPYDKRLGNRTSSVVPEDLLREFLDRKHSSVLTDDYAPVDNLIAPVFEERFGYRR